MYKPFSVVDDEELARLRLHSSMLREAIAIGAVWTGKSSPEWERLTRLAKDSEIPGLTEELEEIKRVQGEWQTLHSADPW